MPSSRNSQARSIRFRLTSLFVAIFGATLIVFSALLYSGFAKNHQLSFDSALYDHALTMVEELREGLNLQAGIDPSRHDAWADKNGILPFSVGEALIQVVTLEGHLITKSSSLGDAHLPALEADWNTAMREGVAFRTVSAKEIFGDDRAKYSDGSTHGLSRIRRFRMITYLVRSGGAPSFVFQAAVSTTHLEQSNESLLLFFVLGIPLTLLVAMIGGLFLSGRALAPVSAIIDKVKEMSPRKLNERIPLPTADDELREMAVVLNRLLDRLEQAFNSQERFIADASHELKTPLAILHGELDQITETELTPEKTQAFIHSASQEVHHLIRLVEDLLLLARVDAGAACLVIQPVRLEELLIEVTSRLQKLARQKDVHVKLNLTASAESGPEASFETNGDPVLIQVMLKNILENAIKFSPEHSVVAVEARSEKTALTVKIRDRGPGIPPEMLTKIFDRFFRAKSTASQPGVGLGLAIARRIADLHEMSLGVESAVGSGTEFKLEIRKN